MRLGCIGIGSNAIRLLVASWKDGQLCDVRRERRGTRLFAGLIGGRLTEESIQSSVNAVEELAQCARGDGAQEIFVFATSAVRDAVNGRAFTDRCEAACGARVEIVSGEEEAVLSYIGASDGGVCGMIDIGGGSTEFTLGEGEKIRGAVSLQMGAVRMNAQRPVLRLDDYAATVEQCRRLIQRDAQGLLTLGMKPDWVGVGGTMTTLGAMQRAVPLFDAARCEGMRMDFETVAGWGRRLARMSMAERQEFIEEFFGTLTATGAVTLSDLSARMLRETLRFARAVHQEPSLHKMVNETLEAMAKGYAAERNWSLSRLKLPANPLRRKKTKEEQDKT